jgi:hypothetical protein
MENNKQTPQVTLAEVQDWEEKFKAAVSPLVKFGTQDNGYSMKFYNGESGVDAFWSGNIILKADNYINWSFSVVNGVFMDAKLNLDDTNNKIPMNLYEFFRGWQTEVSQTLTEPKEGMYQDKEKQEAPAAPAAPDATNLAGPGNPNASAAPEKEEPLPPLQEGRRNKTRQNVILGSSDRMRRLAGLD